MLQRHLALAFGLLLPVLGVGAQPGDTAPVTATATTPAADDPAAMIARAAAEARAAAMAGKPLVDPAAEAAAAEAARAEAAAAAAQASASAPTTVDVTPAVAEPAPETTGTAPAATAAPAPVVQAPVAVPAIVPAPAPAAAPAITAPVVATPPRATPVAKTTTYPPDGPATHNGAYLPQWVNEEMFERQLQLVHGKAELDPKVGLFGPHSMMWQLSRYIAPGALGAGRALVLQISHPWVTAGIDEHSITRKDPLKRGRNTFRYIYTMIYGTREQAIDAARDVRIIHERVRGKLRYPAGKFMSDSEYRANEVQALLWVHATLWETLVMTYEQSVGPLNKGEKERFYQETKLFAYLFGIPDEALPANWDAFVAYCEEMRNSGMLAATPASRELAGYLFGWHGPIIWLPMQYAKVATAAYLPPDLREGYGFKYGMVKRTFFKTTLATSRVLHRITPDFMITNPVHKEAVARIAGKRASLFTRMSLKLGLGNSRLTNQL